MATYSARLPRARLSSWRRRWPPIHSFLAHSLESVRTRVYLTLISVILITLLIAGVVFFFLLGGYQDRLAESTLREISAPVYAQYVESASGLEAASVSRSSSPTLPAPTSPPSSSMPMGR